MALKLIDQVASETVKRLLEYGKSDVRQMIANELTQGLKKLLVHRTAAPIVDYAIVVVGDELIKRKALQYALSPKFRQLLETEENDTINNKFF